MNIDASKIPHHYPPICKGKRISKLSPAFSLHWSWSTFSSFVYNNLYAEAPQPLPPYIKPVFVSWREYKANAYKIGLLYFCCCCVFCVCTCVEKIGSFF